MYAAAALSQLSWREKLEGLAFVAVIMALITAVRYLNELLRTRETRNWTPATATITSVTSTKSGGVRGNAALSYWVLKVTYDYTATEPHLGQYTFQCDLYTRSEELVASLPGTTFPIRYNPANEATSRVRIADRPDGS